MKLSPLARVVLYALLAAGVFIMVAPFLYMVATALTRYAYTLPFPPRLYPTDPTLENFVRAWTSNNFARYTMNSLLVATSAMVLTVTVSTLTAYGFSRFQFPAKELIFKVMLITMMIPGMVALIPTFLVMRDLHLLNSRLGLVLLYASTGIAFNTFLLRSFFEGLPKELEEAVLVDGGNRWTILRHVIIPLSTPALATVAIFSFMGAWDEFWWAMTLIQDEAKRTLPIAIRLFQGMHATNYSLVFAASLIAMVPGVGLFVFFQRYFIQGLRSGATKG
ncbi:MAG TPA: carbohydrate ABC transporter permease [Clostridiales bacterium]|nr:carbohydrate ABC transporter permease [Clostridiales bacterium]